VEPAIGAWAAPHGTSGASACRDHFARTQTARTVLLVRGQQRPASAAEKAGSTQFVLKAETRCFTMQSLIMRAGRGELDSSYKSERHGIITIRQLEFLARSDSCLGKIEQNKND